MLFSERELGMRKIAFAALAAGVSLMAAPAFAAGSPVLGTWNTVAKTEQGSFEATMTISEANGGYTVEMKEKPMTGPDGAAMPPMASKFSDVKVDGSNFSFKRSLNFGDMPMDLTYSGSVNGNNLTAQVNSPMGAIPVTGTRQ